MTQKELVTRVAALEGKKHEASVGDIREILRILAQLEADTGEVAALIRKMASSKGEK